jgi:hypothetical protein
MKLTARQSETLRDIRYLEMSGLRRAINAEEAQEQEGHSEPERPSIPDHQARSGAGCQRAAHVRPRVQ